MPRGFGVRRLDAALAFGTSRVMMNRVVAVTIEYRESLPLVSLCSQILAQPSVVTNYQLGAAPGTDNGFNLKP